MPAEEGSRAVDTGGAERDRVARDSIAAGGSLLVVTALLLAGANWVLVTVVAAAVGAAAVAAHSRNERRLALLVLLINAPPVRMRARRLLPNELAAVHAAATEIPAADDWDTPHRAELYERFPDGFRCLVTTSADHLVGSYCVLPLDRSATELVMGGNTLTPDITPGMITSPRNALSLHIADVICTGSHYERGLLLADLHDQVLTLAAHSRRIRYVTAQAVSRSTGRTLERRGFVYKAAMKTDSANRRLYIWAVGEQPPRTAR